MGKRLAAILCLMLALSAFAQDGSGISATLKEFALPEYKSDGSLQFILYGEKAVNLGALVNLENPIVDVVQEGLTDINAITPVSALKLYPLGTRPSEVSRFWAKIPHCRAIIYSSKAVYDKNTRILTGDLPAYFRMRELDLDGVGFSADQEKRFIHIRSKVRVAIRPEYRKIADPNNKPNSGDHRQ